MIDKKRILKLSIIVLILLPGLILGLRLTKKPVDLVKLSLNHKEVRPNDDLVLTLDNHGFRGITLGYRIRIYREYSNGTLGEVKYPSNVAWPAVESNIIPLIGSHKEKVYIRHLEPGEYLLKKNFRIKGRGTYSKTIELTVINSE